jgi:hypothetical protein
MTRGPKIPLAEPAPESADDEQRRTIVSPPDFGLDEPTLRDALVEINVQRSEAKHEELPTDPDFQHPAALEARPDAEPHRDTERVPPPDGFDPD